MFLFEKKLHLEKMKIFEISKNNFISLKKLKSLKKKEKIKFTLKKN